MFPNLEGGLHSQFTSLRLRIINDSSKPVTGVIAVMILAPAAVAVGLLVFKSVALTFLLFHGGVCLAIPLTDMVLHRIPSALFLRKCGFRFESKKILSSLLWGFLSFALVFLFFALFHRAVWDKSEISRLITTWGIHRMNPVLFVSMMVLGNAFLEEFFWRGYIPGKLTEIGAGKTIIILPAVFYASYHTITTGALFSLSYAVISSVFIFAAGILWGWVRVKTGSLLFSLVTHLFIDLAIMAAYLRYLV